MEIIEKAEMYRIKHRGTKQKEPARVKLVIKNYLLGFQNIFHGMR